jgi:hypothetical protein
MNIYGDMRTCIKCKNKADVVEKGKDYCASCWFRYFSGETIEQYEKRTNELEQARKDKYEKS